MLKMFVIIHFKKGKHPLIKNRIILAYYPANFHHQFQKQTINIMRSENYEFQYYHICLATNMINTINAFNRIIEETLITNLTDSLKFKNFHPLHR